MQKIIILRVNKSDFLFDFSRAFRETECLEKFKHNFIATYFYCYKILEKIKNIFFMY